MGWAIGARLAHSAEEGGQEGGTASKDLPSSACEGIAMCAGRAPPVAEQQGSEKPSVEVLLPMADRAGRGGAAGRGGLSAPRARRHQPRRAATAGRSSNQLPRKLLGGQGLARGTNSRPLPRAWVPQTAGLS
jgi:hypothetical protein